MARYGQDFDWTRGGMTGRRGSMGGYGRGYGAEGGYGAGGMGSEGYGRGYGGMRSDAYGRMDYDVAYRGDFGWGGGTYDVDYTAGARGGYRGGYGTERDNRAYGRMGEGRGGGRVRAADLMTDNPETVTPDTTLADAARKMRDLDVGIIPVVDSEQGRRLRGVITDRDIAVRAVAEGKDAGNTKVSEIMTSDVETCNKNDSVRDVMSVMEREQVRRVPITDREGRLVGIIAQADLAVDYGERSPQREREVEETIERISEPGRPRRGGMQAGGRTGRQGRQSQQRGEETR